MKQKVNEKIKFREPFRPFAPAVLAQEADKFFEVSPSPSLTAPECFMLAVAPVREEMKTIIPAVTHVDGTARLQFVHQETNPFFYGLISAFNRERGVPVILNTSFNLRGEPIVNSPEDALFTFFNCDLDFLVLEDFLVWKEAIG